MMRRAAELGIEFDEPRYDDEGRDHVRYRRGERFVDVACGRHYPDLTPGIKALIDDKRRTKALLEQLELPAPRSRSFDVETPHASVRAALEEFMATRRAPGRAYVCKPDVGARGVGVILGLEHIDELVERVTAADAAMMVEEQIAGEDLRIHVIGRRIAAACRRRPARVIGDGRSTLESLIADEAARVAELNPQNRLEIDAETLRLLAELGRTLAEVPALGEVVPLKRVANISTGGAAIDVTDAIHPAYHDWTRRIADALALEVFAFDVITTSERDDPRETGAVVLEINSTPQWLHHTFSEGRTHDIAAMVLRLFLRVPLPS